jgi:hypothetical protein
MTHNSLGAAMASVGQRGPLDTPWHRETHVSGEPDLQNTNFCVALFQTILLREGSILDLCYEVWESLPQIITRVPNSQVTRP